MAKFVRGIGIENATAYELYKKNGDNYEFVARKYIGKRDCNGYSYAITQSGWLIGSTISTTSGMIDVTDFDENNNTKEALKISKPTDYRSEYLACAFYKTKNTNSFVGGYTWNAFNLHLTIGTKIFTGKKIAELAKSLGANYVRFCGAPTNGEENPFWIYTPNKINFRLDEYTSKLPEGETHQLVVKALGEGGVDLNGDGVIYEDSEYCLGKDGKPLSYTV